MNKYGIKYTPAEDAILRANYNLKNRFELAKSMGRTVDSVRKRAHRLGLTGWKPPERKPDIYPQDIVSRAKAISAEVERRRELHAARMAGCPLERWLASRENIMTGRNLGGATGPCKCCRRRQKFREAA